MKDFSPFRKFAGLLLALLLVFPLTAQEGDGGTESLLHEGGISARAFSLGRAFTALADDPSAVFWNPSGLEYVPKVSLTLFHMPYIIEGASNDFLGFVYPTLNFGTVGIGYSRTGVDGVDYRDENNLPLGTGTFDFSEIYISYAKKTWFNTSLGITSKFHRQAFSSTNQVTSGFGMDAGMMYRPEFDSPLLRGLSLGMQYHNIIKQQLKLGETAETFPNKISFGLMKSITMGLNGKWNIVLDYVQSDAGGRIHAGSEYHFRDLGTLRVGFDQNSPAFGAGINYKFMQIDYSFGNLSEGGEFSPVNRFSLTFNLGLSREQKTLIAEERRKQRERELVEATKEQERQQRIALGLQQGSTFLNEGKFFDAYSSFQKVMADDPFNKAAKAGFDSSSTLIQTQFDQRQQEAIAQAVNKELAIENQKFIKNRFDQGQIFRQNRQYTDALKEFNLALERAGQDPIIQEAIDATKRQLNREVRTLVTNARQEFAGGNYYDALRILSEALVLSPEADELKREIETLNKRIRLRQYMIEGLAHLNSGEYQEAFNVFEEALKLDPSDEAIQRYYDQARLGRDSRRRDLDPEDEKQYIIGTEHYLAGRYEKALEVWKQLAAKEKNRYNKKLQDAIKRAEDRIRRAKENQ